VKSGASCWFGRHVARLGVDRRLPRGRRDRADAALVRVAGDRLALRQSGGDLDVVVDAFAACERRGEALGGGAELGGVDEAAQDDLVAVLFGEHVDSGGLLELALDLGG
jgi:hypothetical protein